MCSLRVEDLQQHHVDALVQRGIQPEQEWMLPALRDPFYASRMVRAGPSSAYLDDSGVLSISGLVDYPGTGRCVVWLVFAGDVRRQFAGLFKIMHHNMKHFTRNRYEAYIDPSFNAARRFASIGGFEREGLMRKFENGHDRELWALVR